MGFRKQEKVTGSKGQVIGYLITEGDGVTQRVSDSRGVVLASYVNGQTLEGLGGRLLGRGNSVMRFLPKD